MGFFSEQFSDVVEWAEYKEDIIFWKWNSSEIKKGSKLIIRPGQDAIFMYNGKIEGIFTDEGRYDIETEIIPFLSTLKGFKFGFNSGIRAEVLFINTKELTDKWGTKKAINIPAPHLNLVGGLPVRGYGTFSLRIADHRLLIDRIAGIKNVFTMQDLKDRVSAKLDQLLMKWIVQKGGDLINLMTNADSIAKGICEDLDMEMHKIGITITDFTIQSMNYPEEIQKMIEKTASQSMVGDINRYQTLAMTDAMTQGKGVGGSATQMANDMAGIQIGMMMGQQMVGQMTGQTGQYGNLNNNTSNQQMTNIPNFCPNCGTKTGGTRFCSNCGTKLI